MTGRVVFLTLTCALGLAAGPAAAVGFSRADRNNDGAVTYAEAKRAFPQLAEVHFNKCDPNGDGVVDQREFPLLNDFYRMNYRLRD